MNKFFLSKKGLSLSQAQSISNLCNQLSQDIELKLSSINNSSKWLDLSGKVYMEQSENKMPENVVELLQRKATLHATQAFLMENIKRKTNLIDSIKAEVFNFKEDRPTYPDLIDSDLESQVGEDWGWSQLSREELSEYLEAEAYASHIGQFIHSGGKLDTLRKSLPKIKTLEWITVKDGERTPLNVNIHHTQEELTDLHVHLSTIHRKYEQRVNYYKSKVKNLVSSRNSEIIFEN